MSAMRDFWNNVVGPPSSSADPQGKVGPGPAADTLIPERIWDQIDKAGRELADLPRQVLSGHLPLLDCDAVCHVDYPGSSDPAGWCGLKCTLRKGHDGMHLCGNGHQWSGVSVPSGRAWDPDPDDDKPWNRPPKFPWASPEVTPGPGLQPINADQGRSAQDRADDSGSVTPAPGAQPIDADQGGSSQRAADDSGGVTPVPAAESADGDQGGS